MASPMAVMLQQQITTRFSEDARERYRISLTYRTRRALGVGTKKMRARG